MKTVQEMTKWKGKSVKKDQVMIKLDRSFLGFKGEEIEHIRNKHLVFIAY